MSAETARQGHRRPRPRDRRPRKTGRLTVSALTRVPSPRWASAAGAGKGSGRPLPFSLRPVRWRIRWRRDYFLGAVMESYEGILTMLGLSAAASLLIIALVAAVLHFFVALNAPPRRRAFWTVAPAYALCVFFGTAPADSPFPIWVWPVGALVPAAIWYWFWLRDFEKRWYQNLEDLPDRCPACQSRLEEWPFTVGDSAGDRPSHGGYPNDVEILISSVERCGVGRNRPFSFICAPFRSTAPDATCTP